MADTKLRPCPLCGHALDEAGECQWCARCAMTMATWNEYTRPLTPKQAAADEMFAKLDKVAKWLESLAANSEKQIETCRFESLNEAHRADAKNYRATAADIRAVMPKAGRP